MSCVNKKTNDVSPVSNKLVLQTKNIIPTSTDHSLPSDSLHPPSNNKPSPTQFPLSPQHQHSQENRTESSQGRSDTNGLWSAVSITAEGQDISSFPPYVSEGSSPKPTTNQNVISPTKQNIPALRTPSSKMTSFDISSNDEDAYGVDDLNENLLSTKENDQNFLMKNCAPRLSDNFEQLLSNNSSSFELTSPLTPNTNDEKIVFFDSVVDKHDGMLTELSGILHQDDRSDSLAEIVPNNKFSTFPFSSFDEDIETFVQQNRKLPSNGCMRTSAKNSSKEVDLSPSVMPTSSPWKIGKHSTSNIFAMARRTPPARTEKSPIGATISFSSSSSSSPSSTPLWFKSIPDGISPSTKGCSQGPKCLRSPMSQNTSDSVSSSLSSELMKTPSVSSAQGQENSVSAELSSRSLRTRPKRRISEVISQEYSETDEEDAAGASGSTENSSAKKIKMSHIQDPRNRQVTLLKRKNGVMKKDMWLSILCDCEVSAVIQNRDTMKTFEYASHDMDATLNHYARYKSSINAEAVPTVH